MECPNCRFTNPEDHNFCGKCGSKLERICSSCGAGNPGHYRFCCKCGTQLGSPEEKPAANLSGEEKIRKIQRYLPQGLVDKILSRRDKIEGERKLVTVMFCDLVGFSALTETYGSENAYHTMDRVYETLIHKVREFDGTVNEMTGDGIMALFGAPIALEDAPQRAINSSLAIHREMAMLGDQLKRKYAGAVVLKMRIGIHSGPVVVGTLGNDLRVEFKAVGETVNLASRMEQLAEPGTTYITGDTFRSTEGLFRVEALGKKAVKGHRAAVDVFQVIAPSSQRTRFDVSAERGLTPFIGRNREIDTLLEKFERAKEGRGQAVSVISEAGIGKSRLLYEFRKAILNENATILEGKCLSFSNHIAYHPVIDVLKSSFDLNEDDSDRDIVKKLKAGIKLIGADEAEILPYLLELLSVKDSGLKNIPISLEAIKDRIVEALKRILLSGSTIRPLILAVEDLHWIDRSSRDILKELVDSISGSRVFLIFTYRPEFEYVWGNRSYHYQITLSRLTNRETVDMVCNFLGSREIAGELEDLILEKTEGVPFYIEEFVRSLVDLKIIEKRGSAFDFTAARKELEIPSTIQAVIMARVDTLSDVAKKVLQTASVIGREFSYDLILRVADVDDETLRALLGDIKDTELLYERGMFPQTFYIFKHALTQEVVYHSILSQRKKALHRRIGDALLDLHSDGLEEYSGILATHYIAGEKWRKGAKYAQLAAKRARKKASLFDAIAYSQMGIECLEKMEQDEKIRTTLVDRRTTLGLYNLQIGHSIEAKQAVDPIIDIVLRSGNDARIAQTNTILGQYSLFIEEDLEAAYKYLRQGIAVSERGNDLISFSLANFWLAVAMGMNCDFETAVECLEKVLEINIAVENVWGISSIQSHICQVLNLQGRLKQAYEIGEQAAKLAEESGDVYTRAQAYANFGYSCACIGFIEKATEYLSKSYSYCERLKLESYIGFTSFFLAEALFELGRFRKAKAHYKKAVSAFKDINAWPSFRNLNRVGIIRARMRLTGERPDVSRLEELAVEMKLKMYRGWIYRYISEVTSYHAETPGSEAFEWAEKAIAADAENKMAYHLGKDYLTYAGLLKKRGQSPEARDYLGKAIEIFRSCGAGARADRLTPELEVT